METVAILSKPADTVPSPIVGISRKVSAEAIPYGGRGYAKKEAEAEYLGAIGNVDLSKFNIYTSCRWVSGVDADTYHIIGVVTFRRVEDTPVGGFIHNADFKYRSDEETVTVKTFPKLSAVDMTTIPEYITLTSQTYKRKEYGFGKERLFTLWERIS